MKTLAPLDLLIAYLHFDLESAENQFVNMIMQELK